MYTLYSMYIIISRSIVVWRHHAHVCGENKLQGSLPTRFQGASLYRLSATNTVGDTIQYNIPNVLHCVYHSSLVCCYKYNDILLTEELRL